MDSGHDLKFQFSYDVSTDKYGYIGSGGTFVPFESGGTDVSDTTATAATVLSGYYFYTSDGDRTQGTYIPIDTSDATAKAKNIESGYTAYVNGVKITGIANVSHTVGKYTGYIESLSYGYGTYGAITIGNRAFVNVYEGSNRYRYTDTYDENLIKTIAPNRNTPRDSCAITKIKEKYVLMAGGGVNSTYYKTVDVYNQSLTLSTAPDLSVKKSGASGGYVDDYGLVIAGQNPDLSGFKYTLTMDVYDENLTKTMGPTLNRYLVNAPTGYLNHRCVILPSGCYYTYDTSTYVYNNPIITTYDSTITGHSHTGIEITVTTPYAGANVSEYLIYGGGYNGSSNTNYVISLNSNFSVSTLQSLPGKYYSTGTSAENKYAFLWTKGTATIVSYDQTLTQSSIENSIVFSNHGSYSSTSVGIFGLYFGYQSPQTNIVALYES